MKIEDLRNITFNIFVMLLVVTLFFYIYNQINPFDFPGLWQRIFFFDVGFGILALVLYFSDIVLFLNDLRVKIKFKKPWERKIKYRFEYEKLRVKRYHSSSYKLDLRKIIESFKDWKIKFPHENEIKKFKNLNSFLIFIGFVIYGIFLLWIFPKLSFDEFMFFVILLYIPISLKLKLDSRYPIILAIVLLITCGISMMQNFEKYGNRIAIYVYYCLVIGIALMFIDYLKNPQD